MTKFTRDPGTTWNLPEVQQVLIEAHTYFCRKEDVRDGDYGVPEPNEEMGLARRTDHAIEYLDHLIKTLKELSA